MKRFSKGWQFAALILICVVGSAVFNTLNPNGLVLRDDPEGEDNEALVPSSVAPAANSDVFEKHTGPFSESGFPVISWAEMKTLLASVDAVAVDARPKWSFDAGHIPGAVSLPFSFTTVEPEALFANQYDRDRHLIIYCGDTDCERSEYLAKKLRDQFQYAHLWLYEGGYEDYLRQEH